MTKKPDLRSEEAMKKAAKLLNKGNAYFQLNNAKWWDLEVLDFLTDDVLAIFDLRDCYRKRAPLKGITKKIRKAIQPKRKKR